MKWKIAALPMASATAMLLGSSASGQTLPTGLATFANYSSVQGAPTQSFKYTDTFGPAGTPSTVNPPATGTFSISSAPVNFKYQVPSSYDNNALVIPASLSFNGTAVGAATVSNGLVSQAVSNVLLTLTAVSPDTATGKTGLLTATFTSGVFFFDQGTGVATFAASDVQTTSGQPGINDYKSDFLDFNNPTASNQYYKSEQFSIALSAVNSPGGSGNPGPILDANNTIESFTADSTGTFSSNPAPAPPSTVPDANALALLAFGVTLGGGRFLRPKRKKTSGSPV